MRGRGRGRERVEKVRREEEAPEVRGRVVAPGGEKAGGEEDGVVLVGQGECELAVGS